MNHSMIFLFWAAVVQIGVAFIAWMTQGYFDPAFALTGVAIGVSAALAKRNRVSGSFVALVVFGIAQGFRASIGYFMVPYLFNGITVVLIALAIRSAIKAEAATAETP